MTNATTTRRPMRRTRILRSSALVLPMLALSSCWALNDTEATILRTTVGIPVTECASATRLSTIRVPANLVFVWGDGSDPDIADPEERNALHHCYSHTYAEPGRYEGSVSVDPGNAGADRRSLVVEVGPATEGYILATTCSCHTSVALSATGIQSVIGVAAGTNPPPNTYTWRFSNGTNRVTTAPILPAVDLVLPGTYQVTLDAVRPAYWASDVNGPAHARTTATFTVGA